MKKLPYFFAILLITTNSYAKFYSNGAKECYIDTSGINTFWFCGNQSTSCAGKGMRKYMKRHWYYHGESFYKDGTTYWCCNGTQSNSGRFVEGAAWEKSEIVTKQLENGTCNYEKKTNVCGEVSGDCTVPDQCNKGSIMRNNECVVLCSGAYAFENDVSNECIPCETTQYQGISSSGVCTRCDPGTQFFDKTSKKCIEKNSLETYSKTVMKKCFACPNTDVFKTCIKIFNLPENQQKNDIETYNNIIKECLIKTEN